MSNSKDVNICPKQFQQLMQRAVNDLGISPEQIKDLKSVRSLKNERNGKTDGEPVPVHLAITVILLILLLIPVAFFKFLKLNTEMGYAMTDKYFSFMYGSSALDERCLIEASDYVIMAFRAPIDCSECADVTGVHEAYNLSHADFLDKYAFSMQPVLVKDGQDGWTAKDTFNFDFFRNVYSEGSVALKSVMRDCQFFPYRTEFNNLGEMLNMSRDRVEGKGKPWYVGWSNCDGKAANILRKHYQFPYFLPPELDHSKTDWVFMGLPGYGAFVHIDSVEALSWQAQVKGTKKWILESPPECAGICIRRMEIIVEPGDIIVLDTNKWFHSTLILGNDTSVVIGSEYY